jgi:FSR family fosmidomycin resistance protein-like MFS transporter
MNEKKRVLLTVSIYHALNDGTIAAIPILFPVFKEFYNLSYTQVGIITGTSLLVHLIAQLLIGHYSDGKNSRTILTLGILLISLSMLLLTQTIGFITLLLFLIFQRFSASFFHPIGVGWVSRTFKKFKLDWAMGIQSGSADVGAFIAILTTLYLTEIKDFEFPLYLWAIAGSITVLLGLYITKDIDEKHLTVKILKNEKSLKDALINGLKILKKIKLLIPAFMISGSAWGVIITYLPLLLDEKTALSLTQIGIIVAIWIGIGSIASFCYGRIQNIVGRRNVIILSYLTIGITCILLSYFTNIIIIILIMILLGITVFITYPTLFSFVSEITDKKTEGWTFGIVFTMQLGGGTLLLFLGGFFSDIFGIWIPFMMLGLSSMVLAILLIINYRKPIVIR